MNPNVRTYAIWDRLVLGRTLSKVCIYVVFPFEMKKKIILIIDRHGKYILCFNYILYPILILIFFLYFDLHIHDWKWLRLYCFDCDQFANYSIYWIKLSLELRFMNVIKMLELVFIDPHEFKMPIFGIFRSNCNKNISKKVLYWKKKVFITKSLWYIIEDWCEKVYCMIQSRHFFWLCYICYYVAVVSFFLLLSLECIVLNELQLEYHWSQFLIQQQKSVEKKNKKKEFIKKEIYTRMKFFPFDLHKYDYALIVLVIWFHEFTLAQPNYMCVNKHTFICVCALLLFAFHFYHHK